MCDNCVKVNKKPGQEHEDLLSEDEPNVGLWDSISRLAAVYFFTTSSQQQSVHFKFMFSFHCGQHNVSLQAFADDTQLYLHCRHDDMASTAVRLERCLMEVGHWMSSNRLKLNPNKTELLWAGSRCSWPLLGDYSPALQFGVDIVVSSNHV